MLMVTVLGLSMVAILAGRIPLKGIVAAGLGLMVGTIGEAGAGGSLRMASYDIPYLLDGLSLVIVGLGIFAIPEIVALLRQDRAISRTGGLGKGWMDGLKDWWANIWLSIRTSSIGVLVGVIPGLGGSVVDWIAYGFTVQSAKDKSQLRQRRHPRRDRPGKLEQRQGRRRPGADAYLRHSGLRIDGSVPGRHRALGLRPRPAHGPAQSGHHLHHRLVAGARQRHRRRALHPAFPARSRA